jgi:transcriptional regulator with XRE-family HTH domain
MSRKKITEQRIFSAFGIRLAQIESDFKLQRFEFAKKLGFSSEWISQLVLGVKNNPSNRFIESVCREFGVSKAWLLNGEGEPYQRPQDSQIGDSFGILGVREPNLPYVSGVGAQNFEPLREQTPPALGKAVDLLATIINSGDQIIITALMHNLHAFSRAVEKDRAQGKQIQELENKCRVLEERMNAFELKQAIGDKSRAA